MSGEVAGRFPPRLLGDNDFLEDVLQERQAHADAAAQKPGQSQEANQKMQTRPPQARRFLG